MTLGPILPGRIPATLAGTRLRENIQRTQRILLELQAQAATGQKFFLPSENPGGAIRTIVLQKLVERKTQMQSNVLTDRSFLNVSEASLTTVGDSLNKARAFLLAGVGTTSSPAEKLAMAVETRALVQSVVSAANSRFNGRYLFAGSETQTTPFEIVDSGFVRYNGDKLDIDSFIDLDFLLANNVDGDFTFSALSKPLGRGVDPALSLDTRLEDLHGGLGIPSGSIVVTVDDTVNPIATRTIDLSTAQTIRDLKTIIEDAFAPGPPTLTVNVDPASKNGLILTPSGGTVSVTDLTASTLAKDLGIASAAAPVINGGDLDPRLTLLTALSDFNNGTGIGPTAGNGILVTNGFKSKTIDISSATTVEDLFNILESEDLDLYLDINDAGTGLAISSRLSGADFTIGENNGNNATLLGLRTTIAGTLLSDLNLGDGVPVNSTESLEIIRRDGNQVSISLAGLNTIQDVIDAINAVDPGVLVASLNTVGNGITILDDDGVSTGVLEVVQNQVSTALGMNGIETGTDRTVPLIGSDVNPIQANGVLNLLIQLDNALRSENDRELARLDILFDNETERLTLVRGEIGVRLKLLEDMEDRLLSDDIQLRQSLSVEFDSDLTEVVTQVAAVTQTLQATLQIAATTLQLSLFTYL
ncbi:MAG: hypothetical protein IH899_10780 [Planctomycetes bacterium]|nr:hypothetical protein [Planctomycetota bacterium]